MLRHTSQSHEPLCLSLSIFMPVHKPMSLGFFFASSGLVFQTFVFEIELMSCCHIYGDESDHDHYQDDSHDLDHDLGQEHVAAVFLRLRVGASITRCPWLSPSTFLSSASATYISPGAALCGAPPASWNQRQHMLRGHRHLDLRRLS